ncbi:MAG: hypothetical protein F4Y42_12735 [Caldilineaceae bacterium SB0664_bin_27]|uniref:Uncharacterized protein n=1 Tax=Caldilineaceae bacterium SB0664_bin_27 TaxID=2605260 RepID=A0A6B0YX26_9CHLR|nr:hypothetical protein [Caldilineaceae bacterium SB0664_bin_27]
MSDTESTRKTLRELPVQYLPDEKGDIQNVLVPIDLWKELLALYEASSDSDEGKQTESPTELPLTMFGAFPELAEIELGEEFEAVKQLGRKSIEKQLECLDGHR